MGIVWEAYHKGVPLLGVPGITLDVDWHPAVGPPLPTQRSPKVSGTKHAGFP